jgi:hypothetical protein
MNRYFAVGYRHYHHHRCCCRRRRRNTGTCNYQGVWIVMVRTLHNPNRIAKNTHGNCKTEAFPRANRSNVQFIIHQCRFVVVLVVDLL